MASNFKSSPAGLTIGTSRTTIYGPIAAGTTAVVFSGTFANLDATNKLPHNLTLEKYDGTTYTTIFKEVPVVYGSASKVPKVVLAAGESLVGSSDTPAILGANVSILERT